MNALGRFNENIDIGILCVNFFNTKYSSQQLLMELKIFIFFIYTN